MNRSVSMPTFAGVSNSHRSQNNNKTNDQRLSLFEKKRHDNIAKMEQLKEEAMTVPTPRSSIPRSQSFLDVTHRRSLPKSLSNNKLSSIDGALDVNNLRRISSSHRLAKLKAFSSRQSCDLEMRIENNVIKVSSPEDDMESPLEW